jgi:hypothetical protein
MDSVKELLGEIAKQILNPLIVLGFVIATIYLFYGIVQMIWGAANGSDLEKNRKNVMYGVIGLFIMFSVYGIISLVKTTFGIGP